MKYQVKVDGKVFEVEVEKVGGGHQSLSMANFGAAPAAPVQPVAPTPAPAAPVQQAAPAPAAPATGGDNQVVAPMPGNIWKIVAGEGSQVKAGEVVVILEAMKMENEIVAPCDGTVSIKVTQGQTVDTDQVIAEIN